MIRRYLKAIALILIFLPEPFTTPLGIALLAAVMATSGRKRLSKFKNMEELIKRSLNNTQKSLSGSGIVNEKAAVVHRLNTDQPRPNEDIEVTAPVYQTTNWFDNRRIEAKIWHHTLQNSVAQYEVAPDSFKTSDTGCRTLETVQPVEVHTLKPGLPQNSTINEGPGDIYWNNESHLPDKVVHHTLKTCAANSWN
jgi:hypothetical protein